MYISLWLSWFFIIFWFTLAGLLFIGGYFMFRKFLKVFPKADGKSVLDWQNYYINESLYLWTEDNKVLLDELVEPVPSLFRNIAKYKIAGKIGQLALEDNLLTEDTIIRGYIQATPKRDHKWLIQTLKKKNINLKKYEYLLKK